MRAIHLKLFRELWQLKGQALAIALVIASGVATYLLSASTLESLRRTQATYYADYRFADVFASLKRAPDSLRPRIEALPGVTAAQTRVVAQANLDVAGFADPVNGLLVSLPDSGPPVLNALYLHAGRLPEPGRGNETVVSEAFAEAHELAPGDRLSAVINGRRESLDVVGVGSSPEYIYQIRPGELFPDPAHYGVLWMRRNTLSAAYDMDGAFNDVVVSVRGSVSVEHVIDGLNRLLERYGGARAYARKDQLSHRYLSQEMQVLETMARVFPVIFLGVAIFLLNIVTARLVGTQREQIGVLKAFGYGYGEIGRHYASMVLLIAVVGSIVGVAAGTWLGHGLTRVFVDFYHFPYLQFVLRPSAAATAVGLAGGAALLGGSQSLLRAMRLPPAEAMRPAPPTRYRRTLLERMGAAKWLDEPTRMIARHINRHPLKALLTVLGIALSAAIMMVGSFQEDAIDYMLAVQFDRSAREDLTVTFIEPSSRRALLELRAWDGVLAAEPFRAVPVRIKFGHRSYRTTIMGYEQGADLHRVIQTDLEPATLPDNGLLLTDYLADWLGASPGDLLSVEVLTGAQRVSDVRLAGTVNEYSGVSGYMALNALNRFMLEGQLISGAFMAIDTAAESEIYADLKDTPGVAGVSLRRQALESFERDMAQNILVFALINTILAGTIAVGVIYNNARISFSERAHELASLRVLGYRQSETAFVLLGEFALLALLGIPLGLWIGRGMCAYMADAMASDIYRIPLILDPSSYAFSATVVLVAALGSGWLVYRNIKRLNLVDALKSRE